MLIHHIEIHRWNRKHSIVCLYARWYSVREQPAIKFRGIRILSRIPSLPHKKCPSPTDACGTRHDTSFLFLYYYNKLGRNVEASKITPKAVNEAWGEQRRRWYKGAVGKVSTMSLRNSGTEWTGLMHGNRGNIKWQGPGFVWNEYWPNCKKIKFSYLVFKLPMIVINHAFSVLSLTALCGYGM